MLHFGTGGWRAIIGDEFTKSNIQLVAKAVAIKILEEHQENTPVVIGYDRRFLSKEAMVWAGEVIASNGIRAMLVERSSPTPLVMYYVMAHDLKYGMMITASHNPSLYNGIKIVTEGGRDANEEVTGELEKIIARLEENDTTAPVRTAKELQAEGLITFFNPLNEYLDNVISKIDMQAIRNANLRIAIDPLYGVSIVAAGALRGTGDTFVPSIMNLCSIWLVRLGLALVLVPQLGLRGMWIAIAVELCVRGLLMLVRQLTTKYYEKYKKEPV